MKVYVLLTDQQLVKCVAPFALSCTAASGAEAALVFPRRSGFDNLVNEAELLRLKRCQKPVALDGAGALMILSCGLLALLGPYRFLPAPLVRHSELSDGDLHAVSTK